MVTSEAVHHGASQGPLVVDTRSRGRPALSRPPGRESTHMSSEHFGGAPSIGNCSVASRLCLYWSLCLESPFSSPSELPFIPQDPVQKLLLQKSHPRHRPLTPAALHRLNASLHVYLLGICLPLLAWGLCEDGDFACLWLYPRGLIYDMEGTQIHLTKRE